MYILAADTFSGLLVRHVNEYIRIFFFRRPDKNGIDFFLMYVFLFIKAKFGVDTRLTPAKIFIFFILICRYGSVNLLFEITRPV